MGSKGKRHWHLLWMQDSCDKGARRLVLHHASLAQLRKAFGRTLPEPGA